MAITLTHPTERTFTLKDLDPEGDFKVTFRQATARDIQIRDQLVYASQRRIVGDEAVEITNSTPWSVRQEIECYLTMTGCEGIFRPDSTPLFRFKRVGGDAVLDMTRDEFAKAWGMLHPAVYCQRLWECCLDVNPDWDWRRLPGQVENPPQAGESETE